MLCGKNDPGVRSPTDSPALYPLCRITPEHKNWAADSSIAAGINGEDTGPSGGRLGEPPIREIEVTGVAGTVSVDRDETEWRFTPAVPWHAGAYTIVVRTTLEDLAGNHINRAFDVDTFDPITRTVATETVTLALRIK